MKLKVFDLFCGTGAFSKGFENTGYFEVILGIDLLSQAVETFGSNHKSALGLVSDIRKLRKSDVGDRLKLGRGEVDVIMGGPPCQGFSSIRPFRSSKDDDPRNSLFEEFASYLNYFRPPVFVFENVVGLATHRNGSTLESIQECFASLGYETDWRILNAANFGVPQKRERMILLGAEEGMRLKFPNPSHYGEWKTIGYRDQGRLLRPETEPSLLNLNPDALCPALTVRDAIDDLPSITSGEEATAYDGRANNDYQRARRGESKELTWHVSTSHTARMLEIIKYSGPNISSIPSNLISSGFSSCYSRLAADEPSVTITVNFVHPASNRCIHPWLDRALTPREGARLQSFDDDFAFSGNRTQVVKQIGNAVPPLLGQAVGVAVHEALAGTSSLPF